MSVKHQFFFLLIFLIPVYSIGQIELHVSNATVQQEEQVEIAVMATGFQEVVSMQFSVNWDSSMLDFRAIENFNPELPEFSEREVGMNNAGQGELRVIWLDNSTQGITLEDTVQLFTLLFEAIGEPGSNTMVKVSSFPIAIEFVGPGSNLYEVQTDTLGGRIVIPADNSTSTFDIEKLYGLHLSNAHPNPFAVHTSIKLSVNTPQTLFYQIINESGEVITTSKPEIITTEKIYTIQQSDLPASGLYYFNVIGKNFQLNRKFILQY